MAACGDDVEGDGEGEAGVGRTKGVSSAPVVEGEGEVVVEGRTDVSSLFSAEVVVEAGLAPTPVDVDTGGRGVLGLASARKTETRRMVDGVAVVVSAAAAGWRRRALMRRARRMAE